MDSAVHPLPESQDLRAGALLESLKRFGSFFKEPLFTASATEREAGHGHGHSWTMGVAAQNMFQGGDLGSCRRQSWSCTQFGGLVEDVKICENPSDCECYDHVSLRSARLTRSLPRTVRAFLWCKETVIKIQLATCWVFWSWCSMWWHVFSHSHWMKADMNEWQEHPIAHIWTYLNIFDMIWLYVCG